MLLSGLAACGTVPRSASPTPASAERVVLEETELWGLAWLDEDLLVASRPVDPQNISSEARLWRFRADGNGFEPLPVGTDPSCRQIDYFEPQALPDGRLAILKLCYPHDPVAVRREGSLVAYDRATKKLEVLVDLRALGNINSAQFTFNPTLDRGFIGVGSLICQGIVAVTRTGIERLPISVGGTRSFRLDDEFRHGDGCTKTGRANLPAWSPDGRLVAFVASPASMGVAGQARLDAPWILYLMDPDVRQPWPVLEGIRYPGTVAWSPDSRRLALTGEIGGQGGIWLLDPATTELESVGGAGIGQLAWSPDGRHLAGLRDRSQGLLKPKRSQVVLLPVPEG